MIQNIVFDMGQVLIHWSPKLLVERFHLPETEEEQLILETFRNVEWIRLDHGTISNADAIAAICARLPRRLHPCVEVLVTRWWDCGLLPMEGMEDLIRELKAKGYGIYLLSNSNPSLRLCFPRFPAADCFDGLYISSEHKLEKPCHDIYEDFYRSFSLDPAACFFVDDSPANIEGAQDTGMDGTVFHGDLPRLRRELQAKGIL